MQSQVSPHYNFKLGLIFATVAVMGWGMLPIALKLTAGFIDSVTLTWFRFFVAFVVSILVQWFGGRLAQFSDLQSYDWLKLTLASICSVANYISFVYCLNYLQPSAAQLNFQTAPFFLAFGGVLFFKERLSALQMSCFATLALGMMLFFHPYMDISALLTEGGENSTVWLGILIVQFSVCSWTCYALLQKSLISKLSPANVLLYIYGAGLLLMAPFSEFSRFADMQFNQWLVAIFCAFNTLIAYGCFAQSMKYWPTAQVGATLALTPVLSFISTAVVVALGWWPQTIKPNQLDGLALVGILLVVGSVLMVQLAPLLTHKLTQMRIQAAK